MRNMNLFDKLWFVFGLFLLIWSLIDSAFIDVVIIGVVGILYYFTLDKKEKRNDK